jgi:hydrogenase maturation protease
MSDHGTQLVGLGSNHGDDRAGWEIVARIRELLPASVTATITSDPLIVADAAGCRLLILIDACRGAGPPGSVHRFEWPDPRLTIGAGVSSHGIGLSAALELAKALGTLPPRVIVFAVEGEFAVPGRSLSNTVAAAIPAVVARVLAEIENEERMGNTITPEDLQKLAFFATATDAELQQLAAAARLEEHHTGVVLFREGERLTRFFVVALGTVAVEIAGPDRRTRRIHTVGPGELLGWSPILGAGPMTATARTLTPARLVSLDATSVVAACDADPRLGYLLMRRTAAAIAARLNATRLQLLDVYGSEIPIVSSEGAGQ